jgi:phosphoribosylamine--glycine ligase
MLDWSDETAITVVMASNGYPGDYSHGTLIKGLDSAGRGGVTIFHAGTARGADGRVLAMGGRVLNVSATGATVQEARLRAYEAVAAIEWPGGFCRRDIGWRSLNREEA